MIVPPMIILLLFIGITTVSSGGFSVNCDENRFDLDGKPFRYIAGEVHYFRIPEKLWEDRIKRIRALGLNVLQIYIAWNYHELEPGK